MTQYFQAPDVVFDHPAFTSSPAQLPAGGRLLSSSPHVDGMLIAGVDSIDLVTTGAGAVVKSRVAKGDWAWTVAAGAGTIDARVTLKSMLQRTGETINTGTFNFTPTAPDKGIAILDIFAIYALTIATATTATLRLGKSVYAKTVGGAVPIFTDLLAATAVQKTVTPSITQYTYQSVPFQTLTSGTALVFHKDDLGLIEIELEIVNPATTVTSIAALGCHYAFNPN